MNFLVYKIKMQTKIIDGKKIRDEILVEVKKGVASLPFQPIFCDVLVGEDLVSKQYVDMKNRMARTVGIGFKDASFPITITTEALIKEIKNLNRVPKICGIIVQLPLPSSLDMQAILDTIDSRLDVDCLGAVASDKFYKNERSLGFPTALACLAILDSIRLDLKDKKIVVLGQGELVGKPVAALLRFRGFFPEVITRATKEKETIIKQADVIISGMGNGKFITGQMIKDGVVIIDAGTSESNSAIVGDVDLESVKDIASFVSPVPGGVGPVTVAMLFKNILTVAKNIS
jgi:methylenetetrahydrofolate dehydrogenase (NADP+)/methenyltetrahydrofolate cyclohydrolase